MALLIATLGAGRQSAPPPAPEPEAGAPESVSNDPQITTLLTKSCYQCHATGGSAPWNAAFSPSYWFSSPARQTLDFDAWPSYDAQHRADELRAIAKVVREGEMPPWDYTALDSSARLSPDEQKIVADWADRELASRTR
jgi:mono/diheme cytochrome c family protein